MKNDSKIGKNSEKWYPSLMSSEINRVAIFFRASHVYGFVALFKGYRMSYMKTVVIFAFWAKYLKKDKIDDKYKLCSYSRYQCMGPVPHLIK